jgi:hypothetical protein
MNEDEKTILRLRAGKCAPIKTLMISHAGALGQKSQRRSKQIAPAFQAEVEEAVKLWDWQVPPRADVVVHAQFFGVSSSPTLPKLLKFYLDLLEGQVFKNDRQVRCINATYHRLKPPKFEEEKHKILHRSYKNDKCQVSLKVERLETYKTRLEVLKKIPDQHSMEEDEFSSDWSFFENYQRAMKLYEDPIYRKRLNLSEDNVKIARFLHNKHLQERYLLNNTLSPEERPKRKPRDHKRYAFLQKLEYYNLKNRWLTVEIGELPKHKGDGAQYRVRLRESVCELKAKYPLFFPLVIDTELEIVLAPPPEGQDSKDLDNVLLDVSSIFEEHLVDTEFGEIKGFTGYVNMLLQPSNRIYLRILKPGAILRFHDHMNSSIERFLDEY